MATKINDHSVEYQDTANCYFANHVWNNLYWYMLGVQGQHKRNLGKTIQQLMLVGWNQFYSRVNIISKLNHKDILEIIQDNRIFEGSHFRQVAAKEILNVGVIGVSGINNLIILAPLKNALLLQTQAYTFHDKLLFLYRHLITLDFWGCMACWESEATSVDLCHGVSIIGGKLVRSASF